MKKSKFFKKKSIYILLSLPIFLLSSLSVAFLPSSKFVKNLNTSQRQKVGGRIYDLKNQIYPLDINRDGQISTVWIDFNEDKNASKNENVSENFASLIEAKNAMESYFKINAPEEPMPPKEIVAPLTTDTRWNLYLKKEPYGVIDTTNDNYSYNYEVIRNNTFSSSGEKWLETSMYGGKPQTVLDATHKWTVEFDNARNREVIVSLDDFLGLIHHEKLNNFDHGVWTNFDNPYMVISSKRNNSWTKKAEIGSEKTEEYRDFSVLFTRAPAIFEPIKLDESDTRVRIEVILNVKFNQEDKEIIKKSIAEKISHLVSSVFTVATSFILPGSSILKSVGATGTLSTFTRLPSLFLDNASKLTMNNIKDTLTTMADRKVMTINAFNSIKKFFSAYTKEHTDPNIFVKLNQFLGSVEIFDFFGVTSLLKSIFSFFENDDEDKTDTNTLIVRNSPSFIVFDAWDDREEKIIAAANLQNSQYYQDVLKWHQNQRIYYENALEVLRNYDQLEIIEQKNKINTWKRIANKINQIWANLEPGIFEKYGKSLVAPLINYALNNDHDDDYMEAFLAEIETFFSKKEEIQATVEIDYFISRFNWQIFINSLTPVEQEEVLQNSFIALKNKVQLNSEFAKNADLWELITEIDLRGLNINEKRENNFFYSLPASRFTFFFQNNFKNLKKLDLSWNDLIGKLPNFTNPSLNSLTNLLLAHNRLTSINGALLPEEIQYLDISFNKLQGSIPNFNFYSELEYLDIRNNFFEISTSELLQSISDTVGYFFIDGNDVINDYPRSLNSYVSGISLPDSMRNLIFSQHSRIKLEKITPFSFVNDFSKAFKVSDKFVGALSYFINEHGTATITGINNLPYNIKNLEVIIPSFIGALKVTEIANNAFSNDNYRIIKISFPITLEKIGEKAFKNQFLSSVDLPQNLKLVGQEAFSGNPIKENNVAKFKNGIVHPLAFDKLIT